MSLDKSGRSKMSDIADRMGTYGQYVQIYKNRLIDSGYVQQDGRGYVTFSLRYFGRLYSLDGSTPLERRPSCRHVGRFPAAANHLTARPRGVTAAPPMRYGAAAVPWETTMQSSSVTREYCLVLSARAEVIRVPRRYLRDA